MFMVLLMHAAMKLIVFVLHVHVSVCCLCGVLSDGQSNSRWWIESAYGINLKAGACISNSEISKKKCSFSLKNG